jgi:tight adherence protein C
MLDALRALAADPAMPYAAAATAAALALAGAGSAMQAAGARRALKRRLRIDPDPPVRGRGEGATAPAATGRPARPTLTEKVVERATVFARLSGPASTRQLKQRLVRAGLFSPHAVTWFFLARSVCGVLGVAVALALLTFVLAGTEGSQVVLVLAGGAIAGWLAPNLWLNNRTKAVLVQNRMGFPDFMDLMGVCANAGLSMEAALERVSRELADMYPVLGVHLQILCLEVRAGRSIEDALHAMADRMDIPEVRAFATLLQQSKELGSSLSDALRVFSEDMRHKRLSMAEEKAYALPAKLSVPVTACILPVVLFIAILPVLVRFNVGID